jgi:pilus assembly protein CpaB
MGRRAVVLVIALLLAAAAAFAVFSYLRGIEEDINAGETQVEIYRSTDAIPEGFDGNQVLQAPDVLFVESTDQAGDIPDDAVRLGDLENALSGKVAVGPISPNGILTYSQWVAPTISITPLKELIEPGKHAITLSPGDVQGVNGFPQPGDLVNVIVTIDIPLEQTASGLTPDFGIPTDEEEGGEEAEEQSVVVPYTRYVLQNLEVLATGTEVVGLEGEAQNVTVEGEVDAETVTGTVQEEDPAAAQSSTIYTLEVDPLQAEQLVYAVEQGSIYLTLGPDDNQEVATRGVTVLELFEGNLLDDIFQN